MLKGIDVKVKMREFGVNMGTEEFNKFEYNIWRVLKRAFYNNKNTSKPKSSITFPHLFNLNPNLNIFNSAFKLSSHLSGSNRNLTKAAIKDIKILEVHKDYFIVLSGIARHKFIYDTSAYEDFVKLAFFLTQKVRKLTNFYVLQKTFYKNFPIYCIDTNTHGILGVTTVAKLCKANNFSVDWVLKAAKDNSRTLLKPTIRAFLKRIYKCYPVYTFPDIENQFYTIELKKEIPNLFKYKGKIFNTKAEALSYKHATNGAYSPNIKES